MKNIIPALIAVSVLGLVALPEAPWIQGEIPTAKRTPAMPTARGLREPLLNDAIA